MPEDEFMNLQFVSRGEEVTVNSKEEYKLYKLYKFYVDRAIKNKNFTLYLVTAEVYDYAFLCKETEIQPSPFSQY